MSSGTEAPKDSAVLKLQAEIARLQQQVAAMQQQSANNSENTNERNSTVGENSSPLTFSSAVRSEPSQPAAHQSEPAPVAAAESVPPQPGAATQAPSPQVVPEQQSTRPAGRNIGHSKLSHSTVSGKVASGRQLADGWLLPALAVILVAVAPFVFWLLKVTTSLAVAGAVAIPLAVAGLLLVGVWGVGARQRTNQGGGKASQLRSGVSPGSGGFSWKQATRSGLAYLISSVLHMLVVVLLAVLVVPGAVEELVMPLISEFERPEVLTEQLDVDLTPQTDLREASLAEAVAAASLDTAVELPQLPALPEIVENTQSSVRLGEPTPADFAGETFNQLLPADAPGVPSDVVDNYDQALDRITQEILGMLSQGKVLVVWVFDQSESMQDDQQEIKTRIEKVYIELGLTKETRDNPLLTGVCSYGQSFAVQTRQPTADYAKIGQAIDAVPVDPSGQEIMCQAVGRSIAQYKKFAQATQRQIAVILVTDESGEHQDNLRYLEPTIAEAKNARARIYVLGREAVFGYPYAHMRWRDPDTELVFWRRINRGPETPAVEQLQTNGFYRRYDAHPSGFGPYEQVRMARETGGVFFLLPSLETNLVRGEKRQYQLERMRPYLPNLGPRAGYVKEVQQSALKTTLTKIIWELNPYHKNVAKYVNMRHHFSLKPLEFRQQAAQEQVKARSYILYLEQAIKALEKIRPLRDKELNERWKANYDLMLAQLIAYRVRLFEYGLYLEKFKTEPKPIKNAAGEKASTHWELRLSRTLLSGKKFQEEIRKADELFEQITRDHPGTPWDARARWEKRRGYGVNLVEDYHDPRRPGVTLPNL